MASTNTNMALSPGHPLSGERVLRIPPSNTSSNRFQIYNRLVRIATWNVRSLYMAGKIDNVDAEMKRLQIKILGLSEVRWPGSGKQNTKHGVIYYSGGTDPNHQYGVAVVISSELERSVMDYVPLSDRVMLLKLKTSHRPLNIIQVYAPTNEKSDDVVEEFYASLEEAKKLTKKGEITVVLGDFNAKVGAGSDGDIAGKYGLGERNARGDRLVQFCSEQKLCITNTYFKLHPRRLYTWRSPADRDGNIIRNQIDYVLIGWEFKRFIKSVKTYPGADINSDHNPVVMDIKIRRFAKTKPNMPPYKITDVRQLSNPIRRSQIGQRLEQRLKDIERPESLTQTRDIEPLWKQLEKTLITTQEMDIGTTSNHMKQEWMTDEILQLMNERRQLKATNSEKYSELNRKIRTKCREAKRLWLQERCKEIETFQEKHDLFNVHKCIKRFAGGQRKHRGILKNCNNEILVGIEEKLSRWKEYIENLFDDTRPDSAPRPADINEKSPEITREEVKHAIDIQKNGRAVGPDGIHAETLKLIAQEDGAGLSIITEIFNLIYSAGKIPSDWLKSTFVALPKRHNASQCDDYRMISLMSHVLKVFLRIIHTRIYKKCERMIDPSQFGFRSGMGTREALFSLNVLTQRCRDMNVDVFACFIDYKKAFDCVSHHKMIEILRSTGVDAQDLCIISEIYWHQIATVKVEGSTSEEISIKRGVRQGCVLSPLLFNLYSETVFNEALDNVEAGIKINGNVINNLRYADDTVVIASTLPELQFLMDRIVEHSERYGLFMNAAKTKLVIFSKTPTKCNLNLRGETIEQVSSLKYLGTLVNQQSDAKIEIRARIEQARKTLNNMKTLLANRDLDLELRTRLLRCYVFPVLLYGCESWTLDATTEKRIDAFEMYAYRRMLRVSWREHKTNVEILRRMGKNKELLLTVKERKLQYIGHIMRGERYEVLRLIIEGKVEGKRSVGRRQNSWLKDLRRWLGRTSTEIFRAAVSRAMIANWIANLRMETVS